MTYVTRIKQGIGTIIILIMLLVGGVAAMPIFFVLPDWSDTGITNSQIITAVVISSILVTFYTFIIFLILNKLVLTKDKFRKTKQCFYVYSLITLTILALPKITYIKPLFFNWHAGGIFIIKDVLSMSTFSLLCINVLSLAIVFLMIDRFLKEKE